MIKFIQMYSNGEGDYTEERREKIKDIKREDIQAYIKEKTKSIFVFVTDSIKTKIFSHQISLV